MYRFFLLLFLLFAQINAVDIGSDTAVTRFNTQQVLADGDRIAGFAALFGGFALDSASATGIFDSFFQVSGQIDLNFGTLVLNQDLITRDVVDIIAIGQIHGNGRTLELSPQLSRIAASDTISNCSISSLTSQGASDQVNSVDWNSTGQYVAIAINDPGGATDQVEVYDWDGSSLTLITGVDIDNDALSISWHPTNDWIAVGRTGAGGAPFEEIFIYSFDGVSLTLLDSLTLVFDTANSVSWRPDGDFLAVASTIGGGELRVYPISGGGIIGTVITANLAGDANDVSWNTDGTFLAVVTVNDAGGDELIVYSFDGVSLTLDSGANITATTNSVSWNKSGTNTDIIAVGSELGTGSTLKLFRHSTGVLTELALSISTSTPVNSVHWRVDGSCLAIGLDTNTGGEVRTYEFVSDDLSLVSTIERASDVFDVRWSRDGEYAASGDNSPEVSIYQQNATFVDVIFSDLNIFLNNDLDWNSPAITFTGESSINGGGKTLSLSPTFSFLISSEASLLLKNMTLTGVKETTLQGLDALSTISFQDVHMILDEDLTFSLGTWDIIGDFTVSGTSSITYSSDQSLIIRGDRIGSDECDPCYAGALILEEGTTFNYVPMSGAANLIVMESPLSRLVLNGATLAADELTLTKGSLVIDGESTLNGSTSIALGDGASMENNCCVEIQSAANLNVIGTLTYDNV